MARTTPARDELRAAIAVAARQGQVIDPVLLHGPPGTGKTTLALATSAELGVQRRTLSAATVAGPSQLESILAELSPGSLLFDEAHALPLRAPEILYEAIDRRRLHILAATTDPAKLSRPLFDRFPLQLALEPYSDAELAAIVEREAPRQSLALTEGGAIALAAAARGSPRLALGTLRRSRNLAASAPGPIGSNEVRALLAGIGIDDRGLDSTDRRILDLLARAQPRALGLETIARALELPAQTIQSLYEPYLLRRGLIAITRAGRVLVRTPRAVA